MSIILGYKKWKRLYEQATPAKLTDPEPAEVSRVFRDYQIKLLGGQSQVDNMLVKDFSTAIKNITDATLADPTQGVQKFFKDNKYNPGDPRIVKFQEALSSSTGTQKFITDEAKSGDFVDGTFGVATARVMINFRAEGLAKFIKNSDTMTMAQMAKESKKSTEGGAKPAIPFIPGKTEIPINVGTQSIQG